MDVGIKELKSLIIEVITEDPGQEDLEQEEDSPEEKKEKKIIQTTNNFSSFIQACSRLWNLMYEPEQGDPQSFSEQEMSTENREANILLKDFLVRYSKMKVSRSTFDFKKKEEIKTSDKNIELLIKAGKALQDLFNIGDLNFLARPTLFNVKAEQADKWRSKIKKYARDKKAKEDAAGLGEGAIDIYDKVQDLIGKLKDSSGDQSLNEFAKDYGNFFRSLQKFVSDSSPATLQTLFKSNLEELPNLINSIVKSKPESTMVKMFSSMRKYFLLQGKEQEEELEKIQKMFKAVIGYNVLSKIISGNIFDRLSEYDPESPLSYFRYGTMISESLNRSMFENEDLEDEEDIIDPEDEEGDEDYEDEDEYGSNYQEFTLLQIAQELYSFIFVQNSSGKQINDSSKDKIQKFYDRSEEEDVGKLDIGTKNKKQQIIKMLRSVSRAYKEAVKAGITNKEPDRNDELTLSVSDTAILQLPSFEDVIQGTVGPDKQKVKDFLDQVQEDYDSSEDDDVKLQIQKKFRISSSIISSYRKLYQVANRGFLGKLLDTDIINIPFIGNIAHKKGKKVTETLLYTMPSKLLNENKQQISRLYAIAIKETLDDMKIQKSLGISNENLGPELKWLIEDIKSNNLTEEVSFYLKKNLIFESKDRDDHVNAAFNAIEFYEEGFGDEEPTRNSRQALGGLANLISKGIVACIKQGPSYASAQMELINKAKELGIFDEVAESVIDLSKEDVSPEIRLKENLLQEDAKGPQDLPEDVYVRVFVRGREGGTGTRMITVMLTDKDGNMIGPVNHKTDEDNPAYGDVSFYEKNPDSFECDDASVIAVTQAADGWGPFLYDIAMEIATMNSNGLASDRLTVSPEAQDVWDYYSKFRSDVESFQLDDEYNSLTPQDSDNCRQNQSRERAEDYGGEWNDNALSKRFTKKPTTLSQIRDKLIWEI